MENEYGAKLDRNGYAPSICQSAECCFRCGAIGVKLDRHEVFHEDMGGRLRKWSKRYGLWVRLCHDTCHLYGVHQDANYARRLRAYAQGCAEQEYGWSKETFIKLFGKSYR
jgi:hypothetical protein